MNDIGSDETQLSSTNNNSKEAGLVHVLRKDLSRSNWTNRTLGNENIRLQNELTQVNHELQNAKQYIDKLRVALSLKAEDMGLAGGASGLIQLSERIRMDVETKLVQESRSKAEEANSRAENLAQQLTESKKLLSELTSGASTMTVRLKEQQKQIADLTTEKQEINQKFKELQVNVEKNAVPKLILCKKTQDILKVLSDYYKENLANLSHDNLTVDDTEQLNIASTTVLRGSMESLCAMHNISFENINGLLSCCDFTIVNSNKEKLASNVVRTATFVNTENEFTGSSSIIPSLKAQLAEARKTNEVMQALQTDLMENLSSTEQECLDLKAKLASLETKLPAVEFARETIEKQSRQLESQNSKMAETIQKMSQEIIELKAKLNDAENACSTHENTLKRLQQENDASHSRLVDSSLALNKERSFYEKNLSSQKEQINNLQKQLMDASNKIDSLNHNIEMSAENSKQEKITLTKRISSLEADLNVAQRDKTSLENKLNSYAVQVKATVEMEKIVTKLSEQNEQHKTYIGKLEQDLARKTKEMQDLKNENDSLKDNLNAVALATGVSSYNANSNQKTQSRNLPVHANVDISFENLSTNASSNFNSMYNDINSETSVIMTPSVNNNPNINNGQDITYNKPPSGSQTVSPSQYPMTMIRFNNNSTGNQNSNYETMNNVNNQNQNSNRMAQIRLNESNAYSPDVVNSLVKEQMATEDALNKQLQSLIGLKNDLRSVRSVINGSTAN